MARIRDRRLSLIGIHEACVFIIVPSRSRSAVGVDGWHRNVSARRRVSPLVWWGFGAEVRPSWSVSVTWLGRAIA